MRRVCASFAAAAADGATLRRRNAVLIQPPAYDAALARAHPHRRRHVTFIGLNGGGEMEEPHSAVVGDARVHTPPPPPARSSRTHTTYTHRRVQLRHSGGYSIWLPCDWSSVARPSCKPKKIFFIKNKYFKIIILLLVYYQQLCCCVCVVDSKFLIFNIVYKVNYLTTTKKFSRPFFCYQCKILIHSK